MSGNPVAAALAVAGGLGLAACGAALVLPSRVRVLVTGALAAASGAAGAAAGGLALTGRGYSARVPNLLPLAGVYLRVDALAGVFLAVTGAVVAVASLYGIGYFRAHGSNRAVQAVWPLFALALSLVPVAASVSTLLYAWELMALSSLLLVCAGGGEQARSAGLWYAVMTHLGLVALLAGLVWLSSAARTETFAGIAAASGSISPAVKGGVFVLVLAGFGSKAGMVPLHAWLPRAHPEAPSPVSAVMSAAMVNLGIYGLIRVGFDLMHGGSRWWWLTALLLGALSAVYGIIQAAVETDLKRLLAYSTVENLGLVLLAVGAAGIFLDSGQPVLAALALAAGLLHTVTHAAFKTLLFLGAGSVLHATGTRDLDELGGLRARMPWTTGLFALGALGAAALPGGAGFPSEWLLLQSLIHGRVISGAAALVMLPVAVGAIALSAGLAVATFVKAVGTGFLAKPRGERAAGAHEAPGSMLAGMGITALACAGLALVPGTAAPALARALDAAGLPGTSLAGTGLVARLTAIGSSFSPLLVVAAVAVCMALLKAALRPTARAPRRAAPLWDCGAPPLTARMEYTATSFAEPLQRVFDDVLAPESDLDVTQHDESEYLVARVAYSRAVPDRIEHRLYLPVVHTVRRLGRAAAPVANGSVHRYLGYGFGAVIVLLVVLAAAR
ncbi:MAG TPA: proton-conducting transporter membrane subunit [Actinospica sp.]|nr:proton-conducting transporter membrane subunit [Actinospica sp.]